MGLSPHVAALKVQPLLWAVLLTADQWRSSCNFVSSLHSNFVVNLDFEGDAPGGTSAAGDAGGSDDARLMTFAGGRSKFKCTLPSGNRRKPQNGSSEEAEVTKYKNYFRSAKLAGWTGGCWTTRKDYWFYDVCFSRKILQYNEKGDMRFSLGDHVPEMAELHADGHVTEYFTGGTDNRSTTIHYVCGHGGEQRVFKIDEPSPLKYEVTLTGPAFCAWRHNDGNETRDNDGHTILVSELLEDMRSSCINVTQGWWSYEYCFPHSLTQFHFTGNGERDPIHVLGTLNASEESTAFGEVNMDLVRLKPSISPRERRAPPSNHRTLRQFLGGGTVCDETNKSRVVTMHFQCPPNWQSQAETRIVNINEASLCEYEIMVHTNLLCGHQKFVPALPKGKEEIKCMVQPSR